MRLSDVVARLDSLERGDVMFVRRPWRHGSDCVVSSLDTALRVPADLKASGYEYFLEIPLARYVLGVLGNKPASEEEKRRLLLHYAENDAYPEWLAHC
jgi:hypothetical protein